MPIIPFDVYAELTGLTVTLPGFAVPVGLSVDEPLPDKISGTPFVVGHIPLYPFVTAASFGPTSVPVSVGPGTHYVIFGIDPNVPAIQSITAFKLRLSGAGTVIERTFGPLEPKQYVYIVFEVTKEGAVKPVTSGTIAPGGTPIANPGRGSVYSGDWTNVITQSMGIMLQMMVPLMMMSMMVQMMMGLMQGITGAFGGGVVW